MKERAIRVMGFGIVIISSTIMIFTFPIWVSIWILTGWNCIDWESKLVIKYDLN